MPTGFGVELTVNTVIVSYFFDQFGLPIEIAGIVGAVFGLMNLFCRSIGGGTSDLMGKYFGMRGRLWAYFSLQVCVWMHAARCGISIRTSCLVRVKEEMHVHTGLLGWVLKREIAVI